MQIHEMIYTMNCREQNNGMGSPIARFLGRNTRGAIPNSLDRNINWTLMMQNRALQHQKRVEKKGRKPKETYEIGERVLIQDLASRQRNKVGIVISLRQSQDGTVVSYLLDINGFETARHRKFMRKLNSPDEEQIERALPEREQVPGHERARQPAQAPPLRRSERL